jgi:hypothetical protein
MPPLIVLPNSLNEKEENATKWFYEVFQIIGCSIIKIYKTLMKIMIAFGSQLVDLFNSIWQKQQYLAFLFLMFYTPCQLIINQKKKSCMHFFNHIYNLLIFDSLGTVIMQSFSSPLKFHPNVRQFQF